jgi:dTMP kinase
VSRSVRGAFITLEGTEGVGKSTSLERIAAELRTLGKDVIVTREPGGTVLGEQVREWILHADHGAIPVEVEALLMFAARRQHIFEVIGPALAAGTWVVCDRFTDATFAYQGAGKGMSGSALRQLADIVHRDLTPDLTVLLDAPIATARARIQDRQPDHFERESAVVFERIRGGYLSIAAAEPERVKVVDAAAPQSLVLDEVARLVTRFAAEFDAT